MNLSFILSQISLNFWNPYKREKFIRLFNKYINKDTQEEPSKQLFNTYYGENSVKIDNHVVCHFPARVYNGLEDLVETIINPANCRASRINYH